MLHNIKDLEGFTISAIDGEIGAVQDFYFDDQRWVVRYLVVDTGKWLTGRKVLLSPFSIVRTATDQQTLEVKLTKEQIEESPGIEVDKPVSRQSKAAHHDYYSHPYFWGGSSVLGTMPTPRSIAAALGSETAMPTAGVNPTQEFNDLHLHSAGEVTGYYIEANDGDIGHVKDFIVDDENWAIRYMLIGTRNWLPGKKVVVSADWIERVSWSDSRVYVNQSRDNIQHAPEYESNEALSRDYEIRLHRHYNRAPHWD